MEKKISLLPQRINVVESHCFNDSTENPLFQDFILCGFCHYCVLLSSSEYLFFLDGLELVFKIPKYEV